MRRIMHRWGWEERREKKKGRKGKKSECHAPRTANSFYPLHANAFLSSIPRACVLCVRINLNANERDEKERSTRGTGRKGKMDEEE